MVNTADDRTKDLGDPLLQHLKCSRCGYDLFGSTGDPVRCPECGSETSRIALRHAAEQRGRRDRSCFVIGAFTGVVVWLVAAVTAFAGGEREAWDSPYFGLGFLTLLVVSFALGHAVPRRSWRWGLTITLAHALAIAMTSVKNVGPLWPVSLAYVGIVMLLSLFASGGGAYLARMTRKSSRKP